MKNIIKKYVAGVISLGVISIMAPFAAYAAGVIDSDPSPWGTGITTVSIAPSNTMGVSKTASAQPGDVVAVNVYYHNKGDQTINNFKIRISNPSGGTATSYTLAGTLSGSGVSSISDSARVNINSAQTLTFIPGSVRWFPNQTGGTNTAGQTISAADENALVGGSGFDIGALTPGWSSQGGIVAHFQVGSNGNGGGNNGTAPNVTTNNYSNFNANYGNVTLNGNFDSNGYTTTTSFKYRVNNGTWMDACVTNRGTGSGSYNCDLTNLPAGTYEYKAYATNAYGNDEGSIFTFVISGNNTTSCSTGSYWNGSYCVPNPVPTCNANQYWNGSYCVTVTQNCGSNQYWNGSYCVNNQPSTSLPTASTLGTISVGATAVAVDGYYTANGCDAYTSFKYGTTQSLGNTTGEVNRNNNSGSMAQSLSGLSANTTYYYQAQVRNCVGTTTGSIRSFTTSNDTTRDTVIIRNVTNTTTGNGGSGAFIKLMITNNREMVRAGKEMTYEASWENVSGRDLQNLVLEVNFPDQVEVLDTDHGSIKREAHSVIYKIGDLKKNETGTMDITAQVTSGLRNGDPVVAQAIMAFENPKTRAAENAIAYDADEFTTVSANSSVLGASLFGLDFLPTSLAGWLLIFLILLIIVILAHAYFSRNRVAQVVASSSVPHNVPVDTGSNGNDYIVYRPTPKQ